MPEKEYDVLFICYANVGRSQMAEGIYNSIVGQKLAISGGFLTDTLERYGTRPTPKIVKVMDEIDVNVRHQLVKLVTAEMYNQVRKIIVLCDPNLCPPELAQVAAPVLYRLVADPDQTNYEETRKIRDEIYELVVTEINETYPGLLPT